MESKKVSAIIPFYNGVEWLCEAVESVINQTYKNIEIIVVNDGSKEDISPFLNKYGDRVIYEYQQNQGPAAARNRAMEIATGDYFAFLDSDDIWLPEKTELQISFMEERDIKWSHTGAYFCYNNRKSIVRNFNDYGDILKKSYVSISIQTPCVVVNRLCLLEHPEIKFPNLRKGQDTAFFRMLATYYNIGLLLTPLVKVRMHKNMSHLRAILRFNMRANNHKYLCADVNAPKCVKNINLIYCFYARLFGTTETPLKEFIAKCFWLFPYSIERICLYFAFRKTAQDEKYLKK